MSQPTKLLTVDDSKIVRMIVSRALKTYDCQIIEAANGVEGLAAAEREKPDLILLDITMPVMDGLEMLTRLRQNPELKATPVIMLTAESSQENVARADGLGVSGYVVKPFKEDQIITALKGKLNLQLKAA
jgi:two-component system cell cycle response regulator